MVGGLPGQPRGGGKKGESWLEAARSGCARGSLLRSQPPAQPGATFPDQLLPNRCANVQSFCQK